MVCGPARLRQVAPLLLAALIATGAAAATDPPAAKAPAKTAAPSKRTAAKPAASKPVPSPETIGPPAPDPTEVHFLAGPPPKDIRDYPPGITVLGEPAPQAAGVIRVRVEPAEPDPRLPVPKPGTGVLVFRPPAVTPAPAMSTDPSRAPITIGPGLQQQVGVFGTPPPAGRPLAGSAEWLPTSAYPAGDPLRPYPWNPATFASGVYDPSWSPSSAWPAGQDLRNWSPVTWSERTIDSSWEPHDAWGRQVSAPPPPLPVPEPRPAPPPEPAK